MINPAIFRQYDIRGVWEKDLTPEVVELLGRGYASYIVNATGIENPKVTVGWDARLHSPIIRDSLVKGIRSGGVDVVDLGMCPTPLQYYSLYKLEVSGGIMITGSHNPPEFNGFKISVGKGTIFGDAIQDLRKIIDAGDFREGAGSLETYPIIDAYVEYMKDKFDSLEGIKVVVDAGNGTGGVVAPQIMRSFGAEVVELYCEPDGNFPNHHPDPTVEKSLKGLIAKVREEKAHAGIGYDGDADRIGVVDEEGNVVWGDSLMIIFARDILKDNPGAKIIGEVKCSQTLYDDIAEHGGVPIMWKTGHSLIKEKMKQEGALLAGEMSGHIFFKHRFFGFDDAVYASLRLMEIIKKAGKPYSTKALLHGVPPVVATPEIRFDCSDDIKFSIVEKAQKAFDEYDSITIDGIRIKFDDGWALIRASNTQPILVLRFEAPSEARLKEMRELVEGRLNRIIKDAEES
ncbi:MAG: phosphomannomutase/phosphoglucomutase [Nitrospira sp.]|nr:phosphomannomutase/phosphoglucomutase [bacterium]MBL7048382.1 phosphomannomutase/phosphoglucomutase [Nitrospira sp.]